MSLEFGVWSLEFCAWSFALGAGSCGWKLGYGRMIGERRGLDI